MKLEAYEAEAALEQDHWWFVARRSFFQAYISRLNLPETAKILDIGTSTGTNLRMLVDMGFSNIQGLDFSEHAIAFCHAKGLPAVTKGDICAVPFENDSFDLVVATDILEHVDDDKTALKEIYRILKPGGHALITVPMFMSLWGLQDDISLHKRRYNKSEITNLIKAAPFSVQVECFFNFILFIPIWSARKIIRFFNIQAKSENNINNAFINRCLKVIFELDTKIAPIIKPPFGVSYFYLLQK
ncbi:methyltransferase [Terasakiella brassicae]|uniref:Methyltransferase n=1 Tax=Terasakiella brassicae TaxID=1634917 RepID=A0A917C276_9PROT|nr:class I SAM-dependent methyltransferase [Terasakiella brassicae]GGF64461.1 methyltransferase [Terasakiella brassicae]